MRKRSPENFIPGFVLLP